MPPRAKRTAGRWQKAAFICSKALRESVKVQSEMQVITSFTSLRFVVPALLKDKTCHPFTYAWDETELWANRDQQNRGAETAAVVIAFFLGVFAHIHGQSLCHPGLHFTETQPRASHPRGYFVCCN